MKGVKRVKQHDVTAWAADPAMFTDGVWRSEIIAAAQGGKKGGGLGAHSFTYRPGARSAWHTHDGEQALFVVTGRGFVQAWGDPVATAVEPGDWVHIQPGEKHWHGAAPDSTLVHLAVTASGGTAWHEPVTEQQYRAAAAPAKPDRCAPIHSNPSANKNSQGEEWA